MRRLCRLITPLATLALLLSPLSAPVHAGGPLSARPACRGRTVCDRSLGVSLTRPAGWIQLLPPKVPRHEIDLARLMQGPGYDLRLIIRSFGTTTDRNDRRASAAAANRLIRSERATHVSRTPVRYGGTPGLLLRGLPPTSNPAADIILAHAGALYLIIAPGMNLAPDQRAALTSLRFIPRVGPFPPANPTASTRFPSRRAFAPTQRISPDPFSLAHPINVTLAVVRPGETIVFQSWRSASI